MKLRYLLSVFTAVVFMVWACTENKPSSTDTTDPVVDEDYETCEANWGDEFLTADEDTEEECDEEEEDCDEYYDEEEDEDDEEEDDGSVGTLSWCKSQYGGSLEDEDDEYYEECEEEEEDCEEDEEVDEKTVEEALLYPEKRSECEDQGKMYSRGDKACIANVKLAMSASWCSEDDVDHIIKEFTSKTKFSESSIRSKINGAISDGYTLDQCGTRTSAATSSPVGSPVVTFYLLNLGEYKITQRIIPQQ